MPARKVDSKRIVIDASIARAAGGQSAVHPKSKHCRDFLTAIREICHRCVLTPEIKEEWNRHQSNFALTWRTSMMARKKIVQIKSPRDNALRALVDAEQSNARQKNAAEKDMLLIEAALATDKIVASLDEVVRCIFKTTAAEVKELRPIMWVNPDLQHDETTEWLEAGARSEQELSLGAPPLPKT